MGGPPKGRLARIGPGPGPTTARPSKPGKRGPAKRRTGSWTRRASQGPSGGRTEGEGSPRGCRSGGPFLGSHRSAGERSTGSPGLGRSAPLGTGTSPGRCSRGGPTPPRGSRGRWGRTHQGAPTKSGWKGTSASQRGKLGRQTSSGGGRRPRPSLGRPVRGWRRPGAGLGSSGRTRPGPRSRGSFMPGARASGGPTSWPPGPRAGGGYSTRPRLWATLRTAGRHCGTPGGRCRSRSASRSMSCRECHRSAGRSFTRSPPTSTLTRPAG